MHGLAIMLLPAEIERAQIDSIAFIVAAATGAQVPDARRDMLAVAAAHLEPTIETCRAYLDLIRNGLTHDQIAGMMGPLETARYIIQTINGPTAAPSDTQPPELRSP